MNTAVRDFASDIKDERNAISETIFQRANNNSPASAISCVMRANDHVLNFSACLLFRQIALNLCTRFQVVVGYLHLE